MVNFEGKAKKVVAPKEIKSTKKNISDEDNKPKSKKKGKKLKNSEELIVIDDESSLNSSKRKKGRHTVLPKDNTDELKDRIKKIVSNWAEEEQLIGSRTFCELV